MKENKYKVFLLNIQDPTTNGQEETSNQGNSRAKTELN